MDGKDLLRRLRELLNEESTGVWLDDRTSYDFLYEGSKEFTSRTACLTNNYQFPVVANQANYTLPTKYLKAHLKKDNSYFIKFSTGANEKFIKYKDYQDIRYNDNVKTIDIQQGTLTTTSTTLQDTGQDFDDWDTAVTVANATHIVRLYNTVGNEYWAYLGVCSKTTNANDTVAVYSDLGKDTTGWNPSTPSGTASFYRIEAISSQTTPSYFCIKDKESLYSQITGTATSTGTKSGGQCTLTDTSGLFTTTDYVSAGDIIHNTTDGSSGVVLSITSATALVCALFGGTNNQWASSDAYVIQPQGRFELIFDPPPSISGYITRIDYIERPDPVYSDYGVYRFRDTAMEAIVKYAAWLYKYRDSEPNFGDVFFQWWNRAITREIANMDPYVNRRRLEISFKKRS